jgi:hypothetical protein
MSTEPNIVNVQQPGTNQVTVDEINNLVTVTTGSIGTGTTRRYIHAQGSASDSWNIEHNLGGRPQVTIVDSAGTVVYGEIQYLSNTQIRVLFSAPFSGNAYLT